MASTYQAIIHLEIEVEKDFGNYGAAKIPKTPGCLQGGNITAVGFAELGSVRTVKYRPDYPRSPFQSVEETCSLVATFVLWQNDQNRHSGVQFVTPDQRPSGAARAISRHRAEVYELARLRHSRRWSRSTGCWRQPEVVWINPPPPENIPKSATLARAA